jgi:release factor glutamine methyltransferase
MTAALGAAVREALEGASDSLAAAGIETPRLDAEILLAEATGWDRAMLAADPEASLPEGAARIFAEMARRRARREPVAYILGRKWFRSIELEVDPRVLIPRPETELLVEVALELSPSRVLDVGTGSGAIALAIARELPWSEVFATDCSLDALEVARSNAERLGLRHQVHLAVGTLPAEAGRFDLLVANLPYVSEREWEALAPEITGFEPRAALVSGPTGLEAIELLLGEVWASERPPAAIALEVGAGQAGPVTGLVRRAGYERVETRADLAGIERVVLGR